MKSFNLSQFLGCCVICIGIIIGGWLIGKELSNIAQEVTSPSIVTQTKEEMFSNYLSRNEVAEYLRITEADVEQLFHAGKMEGTYIVLGENLVFSRELLDEWIDGQIGAKKG